MNEVQKKKKKFRQSKKWKDFKKLMKKSCKGQDLITRKKLYSTWQLHHRNLNEQDYEVLKEDWFLPCNNLTHKMIHWLWVYYQKDEQIIDRLRAEMEKMKIINSEKNQ